MSTRLYLSGCESKRLYIPAMRGGANSFLVSFHYLSKKAPDLLKIRKEVFPHHKFFLDSGAYTFLTNPTSVSNFEKEYGGKDVCFDNYLQEYAQFIEANKAYIEVAVELDVEWLMPYGKILDWQDKYFKPLEAKGVNIIYVWHPPRGLDELESMCSRHPYVGVARDEVSGKGESQFSFKDVGSIAKKYLTKIHGFGITSWKQLSAKVMLSADSTTWLVGQQYGEICSFYNGEYIRKHWKEMMLLPWFREYVENAGFDYGLITNPDIDAVIIRDGEEVTRWEETSALNSYGFTQMMLYYEEKSVDSFWEYKMPIPSAVEVMSLEEKAAWFEKIHSNEKDPTKRLEILSDAAKLTTRLLWISAHQNADQQWVAKNVNTFIDDYLKYLGNKAPSPLNVARFNEARALLNAKILPRSQVSTTRTSAEMASRIQYEAREDTLVRFDRGSGFPKFK